MKVEEARRGERCGGAVCGAVRRGERCGGALCGAVRRGERCGGALCGVVMRGDGCRGAVVVLLTLLAAVSLVPVVTAASSAQSVWTRRPVLPPAGTWSPAALAVPTGSPFQCARLCMDTPGCRRFCFLQSTAVCTASPPDNVPGASCYDTCPRHAGYDELAGGLCAKVHATAPDHATAQAACSAEGAHLYDVHTTTHLAVLNQFVSQQTGGAPYLFLGATLTVTGSFAWTDGAAVAPTMWDLGQPSYGAGESCVVLSRSSGILHDAPCAAFPSAFVCQIDL